MTVSIGSTQIINLEFTLREPPQRPESNDPFSINEDGSIDFDLNGSATIRGEELIVDNDLQVLGISSFQDVNAKNIIAETVVGLVSFSSLSNYSEVSGISTVSEGLSGSPNISVGIITASSYVSVGTTTEILNTVGISTVDSDETSFHYITYNVNNITVDISNFKSGKKFEIIARNISGSARNIIVRTSESSSGHSIVPVILHPGGTITNGTIQISNNRGTLITIFNADNNIVGTYIN